MLHKTRAIVFKVTKYAESSVIIKAYTEKFGVQSYIINGVRSTKSKSKSALYQHGNLLEMVVYHKEEAGLLRISECGFAHIYEDLPFNIVKSSLLLFYLEILNKIIKEHEANEALFDFLFEIFIDLDQTDKPLANHHIWFLLALTKYLGCYPTSSPEAFFDLKEGLFVEERPAHNHFLNAELSSKFRAIIEPELTNYDQIKLSAAERKIILQQLLIYYRLHISDFGELRSYDILEGLFKQ
jgi:DNA repair protein RecO (recombination protein O)